jgi:lariat debranching enzyme
MTLLTVGIGDIHGRFHRVQDWLAALEQGRGRAIDLAFAVGDVEAFRKADDHRRKAAKHQMPAEFAEYADGKRSLLRPLYFIGGNNEDFEALHPMQQGGDLIPQAHYLGRAGARELGGLRVAYLSGIYAPKHFETPLREPRTKETQKQAGYFREPEVLSFQGVAGIDLMLTHEWPRGLVNRSKRIKPLRAYRFPWIGNPVIKVLVETVRPKWLWCGHSHVPFAETISHPDGTQTRVACLDQAAKPEGSVFWVEWEKAEPVRAGWGTSGKIQWSAGESWDPGRTPDVALAAEEGEGEMA